MKVIQSVFNIGLGVGVLLIWPASVTAQSGNFSDITGTDNVEIIPTGPSLGDGEESQGASGSDGGQAIDRAAYEAQLQLSSPSAAVTASEEFQAQAFSDYLGLELEGEAPSDNVIARLLYESWQSTENKPIFVYTSAQTAQLQSYVIGPVSPGNTSSFPDETYVVSKQVGPSSSVEVDGVTSRYTVIDVSRSKLLNLARQFRSEIIDESLLSRTLGRQLYDWLIRPMEAQLEAEGIETIVFSLDSGLRGLPLAALHDGEQFLVEKYAIAVIPSFGLTDVGFQDVRGVQTLAMGASVFADQQDLPGVPVEIASIQSLWPGNKLLDVDFTVPNLLAQLDVQGQKPEIIHMATHGEFKPGTPDNSYIQFADRRVSMPEFRQLAQQFGWNFIEQAPELLVLSACRTAVGDESAELGFAGLALQSGAKSALASLWYVSDLGTLALMSEFYNALQLNPLKAEALRQAQISLLTRETRVENGQLLLANGSAIDLPPALARIGNVDLADPYHWSGFMLIGNWN